MLIIIKRESAPPKKKKRSWQKLSVKKVITKMWFMKHSNILISFIMCYCASTGAWTGRLWRCVIHVVIEINLISHKIARSALISVHWKIFLWPQIGNSAKDATRTRIFEVGWMSRHNRSQTNGRHFLWTFTRSRDSEIYVLSKPLLSVSLLCIAVQPDNFHLFYNIFFLSTFSANAMSSNRRNCESFIRSKNKFNDT